MNARITVLTSLALLCAPSIISSSSTNDLADGSGWASVAHAQDDQVTVLAREKFKEGVVAFQSGKFEEARALFLQAYALKRHPAVLLNLGQSELKAGYIEDGGNHLNQFLREHTSATDQQKADAKAGIAEASKRTGQAIMIVDADGADVSIDGKKVGNAPLLDPYFVKPGPHEAGAAYEGKTTTTKFDAVRGKAVPVQLTLGVTGGGAGAVPVPTPTPTPTPSPAGAPPAPQPGAMPQPGYPPAGPLGPQPQPMGPGPGASFGADTGGDGGRENFFDWFVDTPVAWVGAGLTGVGLIGGIAFGAAGGSASSSADDVTAAIQAEVEANRGKPIGQGGLSGSQTPCGPEDDPSADVPYYAEACNQLRDNLDTRNLDYTLMGVFFGVGALAAAGTVIYYFVDTADGGDGSASVQVVPILSPQAQGFGLVGTF